MLTGIWPVVNSFKGVFSTLLAVALLHIELLRRLFLSTKEIAGQIEIQSICPANACAT